MKQPTLHRNTDIEIQTRNYKLSKEGEALLTILLAGMFFITFGFFL